MEDFANLTNFLVSNQAIYRVVGRVGGGVGVYGIGLKRSIPNPQFSVIPTHALTQVRLGIELRQSWRPSWGTGWRCLKPPIV